MERCLSGVAVPAGTPQELGQGVSQVLRHCRHQKLLHKGEKIPFVNFYPFLASLWSELEIPSACFLHFFSFSEPNDAEPQSCFCWRAVAGGFAGQLERNTCVIQASGTFPLLFVGHLNQVAAKNTAAASLHRVITPWEQTDHPCWQSYGLWGRQRQAWGRAVPSCVPVTPHLHPLPLSFRTGVDVRLSVSTRK